MDMEWQPATAGLAWKKCYPMLAPVSQGGGIFEPLTVEGNFHLYTRAPTSQTTKAHGERRGGRKENTQG
jgi:hypothetical protein